MATDFGNGDHGNAELSDSNNRDSWAGVSDIDAIRDSAASAP
jgi:hypothetical protein